MRVRITLRIRRAISMGVNLLQVALYALLVATVLFRLGNMQLDGLLPFGAALFGSLFAFTSLMYNRARTYPKGAIQRRTVFVAELALRATLACAIGAILGVVIFFLLQDAGYPPTPVNTLPTQLVPAVLAFVPLVFLIYAFFKLFGAIRLLLHAQDVPVNALRIARRL